MGTCAPEISTWKERSLVRPEARGTLSHAGRQRVSERWGAANLNLLLVEHAQPLQVDHAGQALPEGQAVLADLPVEPVVGDQVDVRDPVGAGDRDVLPAALELHHLEWEMRAP